MRTLSKVVTLQKKIDLLLFQVPSTCWHYLFASATGSICHQDISIPWPGQ